MAIYTYFGNGNGLGASYGQGAAAFPHPLPAIVTTVAVGRQGESEGGESVGVVCSGTLGWDDKQAMLFSHAGLGRPTGLESPGPFQRSWEIFFQGQAAVARTARRKCLEHRMRTPIESLAHDVSSLGARSIVDWHVQLSP